MTWQVHVKIDQSCSTVYSVFVALIGGSKTFGATVQHLDNH